MSAEPRRGDPALGVFETLRVDAGRAHDADAHLTRLRHSLRALYDLDAPESLAAELAVRGGALAGAHRLRIDAIPRGEAVEARITTSPLPPGPPDPVRCTVAVVAGGLGPHKLRDRAGLEALAPSGITPLIADRDGTVLEAAWGNLWLREDDRLITPPADGRLLPGVTRMRLLRAVRDNGLGLGLTVAEEPVSRARLTEAGAVFLTSALRLAVAASVGTPTAADSGREPENALAWLAQIRDRLGQ